MARISISPEQLRAMYAAPENTFDPKAFGQQFATGMTLQDTIATKAAERQKAELDLKNEIEKAMNQKKLVETAKIPQVKAQPFRDVSVPKETFNMSLDPQNQASLPEAVGRKTAEAGMVQDINKLQGQRRMEEATRVEAANRPIDTLNAARAAAPEEFAKTLIKPQASGNSKFEQQSKFSIVDPVTGKARSVLGIAMNDGIHHPVTRQLITDLNELPDAGFKVDASIAGRDPNTNMPVEYNTQTGMYTSAGKPFAGVVFPELANAPAGIAQSMVSYSMAKQQLASITRDYSADFTGPAMGRYKTVEEWAGTNDPKAAKFQAELRYFQNYMVKAITGAQMSNEEALRLIQSMPTMKDNPAAFISKLQTSAEQADLAMKTALDISQASGYAIRPNAIDEASVANLVNSKFGLTPSAPAFGGASSGGQQDLAAKARAILAGRRKGGK
jgi:hypothetical protein